MGNPKSDRKPKYRSGHRSLIFNMYKLNITKTFKGRAASLSGSDSVYIGQNYNILEYTQDDLSLIGQIPCNTKRKLIEPFRLLCRLFRHEIRGVGILSDGTGIVATRQGLYYSSSGGGTFERASLPATNMRIYPPMTVTIDSQDRVLWGEYWGNVDHRTLRLFVSEDYGKSYRPFWEFKKGDIKHVHNIIEDPYDDCYWVFVGDHGKEPGIGRLSKDLKCLDWLVRGEQKYRVVDGFLFQDKIVYGTDSEKEPNGIYAIEKKTGKMEKLCDIPGSCIYSAKFGKWYAISTSVEPSEVLDCDHATLWVSKDTVTWQQVYQAKKDVFSAKYFQFGSIVLPRGRWNSDKIVFSGQAVKSIDGKVCIAEIVE